jgi:hypothetical protein
MVHHKQSDSLNRFHLGVVSFRLRASILLSLYSRRFSFDQIKILHRIHRRLPLSALIFRYLTTMKTRMLVNSIRIGITDCARYGNYERWILDAPQKADVIRLSYRLNNLNDIESCQGIILSGGEDVDPRRYKRPDLFGRVEFTDIDEKRDDFEMQVIELALQFKLPILSICRGEFRERWVKTATCLLFILHHLKACSYSMCIRVEL